MAKITVELNITESEILRYYQGGATDVSAMSIDGRTVRFPARVIRPFVTKLGVQGVFDIYFDDSGKFIDIKEVRKV